MSIAFNMIIYVLTFTMILSLIVITSFGQQVNNNIDSFFIVYPFQTKIKVSQNPQNDITPPSINITYPTYPPTIMTGEMTIQGLANDSGSGIHNVSASAHTFPFNGRFPGSLTFKYISHDKSGNWSIPLTADKAGTYRVVVTARDNAGNANYAETTINMILPEGPISNTLGQYTEPRIAFVRPSFTEAAYQPHGFIDFYYDYGFPPFGHIITTDLNMLTVKTPKSVPEFAENDPRYLSNITSLVPVNGTELHDISYNYFPVPQKFWVPFIDNVKKVVPNALVTVMRDEDVHDGHIFYKSNTTNAFHILLLFHNEYVTQTEYDNLKEFVKNGGTIVFIDANVFRAEVKYDRDAHTISLVEGHDWQFDGQAASRSVPERWYNETKEWVGSNFLDIDANVTFTNNPFNYTHFEEQFVNNPNAKILEDYGIKFPKEYTQLYLKKEKLPAELQREDIPIENITVATYSLDYGKGEVVMSGLTGRLLADNQEFMEFFDNRILPDALCPKFQSCSLS
jgi:hypothetical protein